jgi:hypothetical protein
MKKTFCVVIVFTLVVQQSLFSQSPGGVGSNLVLWLKANSGAPPSTGGTLTGWQDLTGNNIFSLMSAGTGLTAPVVVLNGLNFNPVVRFVGSYSNGYYLLGNSVITMSEASACGSYTGGTTTERGTMFSPITSAGDGSSRYFFRSADDGNEYVGFGLTSSSTGYEAIPPPASAVATIMTASGTGNLFNQNGLDARNFNFTGSPIGYLTTEMTDIPQIADRSTSDSRMNGDIAEIVVYSAANPASLRNQVESYLALKYGITLGNAVYPINYTSSAGTVFWTGLSAYQHNIFGIGTDNASGLAQTSSNSMNSGSGDGTGQSGMGNLVLNTSTALANGQFLMIGTDSAALTEETITSAMGPASAIGSSRLVRTWKVQTTGTVPAVSLTFDITGLTLSGGSAVTNYYLLIDNDGDGEFKTGTQTLVQASGITGNLISFSGTNALANGVVFTLITQPEGDFTLPEWWEDFTASVKGNVVTLHWKTATNLAIDHFTVYHSTDGGTFTPVAKIPLTTAMPPEGISYEVTEPGNGGFFYRVQAVLNDGTENYSIIRMITIGASNNGLSILSNPVVNGQLRLKCNESVTELATVSLFSASGSRELTQAWDLSPGANLLTMDIRRLPQGTYFVLLTGSFISEVLTFIKCTGMR